MQVAEGLGWLRPRLDGLRELYGRLRADLDSIPAFEQTLADGLDSPEYDRVQSFFDGEHDAVYGSGAGERARVGLREGLEASVFPKCGSGSSASSATPGRATVGEVIDVGGFYDENPARRRSDEVSFGDDWRRAGEPGTWAVFWVAETGELAAMRMSQYSAVGGGADGLEVVVEIARAVTNPIPVGPLVEVLTVEPDLQRVQMLLGDWKREQHQPDSYGSLRGRLELQ